MPITTNSKIKTLFHQLRPANQQIISRAKITVTAAGLISLVSGCNISTPLVQDVMAQAPLNPTNTPLPTFVPPTLLPTFTPVSTSTPLPTPWPTITTWPTATPWPTPAAWLPEPMAFPTLAPLPILPTTTMVTAASGISGLTPLNYSPPDGVDVFGGITLRWEYYGQLAEDEWFDIKIKPLGSENSAFVDWSKSNTYQLNPWNGWSAGIYTWQIGIVKGTKEGDTKHFIADTGRDSQKLIIKWQAGGQGGGDGGNRQSGNSTSNNNNGGSQSGGS